MRGRFLVALLILAAWRTPAHAQNVNAFMGSVASAWARGDVDAITALADPQGVTIDVDRMQVGSVSPKQAAAVLRRIFDDVRTIRASAGTARLVPGPDGRAYAEIVWERRARGTTEAERINVFVAVVRDKDTWRITEIRLIQQ